MRCKWIFLLSEAFKMQTMRHVCHPLKLINVECMEFGSFSLFLFATIISSHDSLISSTIK
jgi:hypothetical protein